MFKHCLRNFEAISSILQHSEAIYCFLKQFEQFWSILKHSEAFWSIFEAICRIFKQFKKNETFWSILKHFTRILKHVEALWSNFKAICNISWSETSNFPFCKLIIFCIQNLHFPDFEDFPKIRKAFLAAIFLPGVWPTPPTNRIRRFWRPPLWPPLEPFRSKLMLGNNGKLGLGQPELRK